MLSAALRLFASLLGILCFAAWATGQEATTTSPEQAAILKIAKADNIKAVYLYSFGRFTQWPAQEFALHPEFRIGIVGSAGVRSSLEKIAGKRTVHDRPIKVIYYQSVLDVELTDCDLLFVSATIFPVDIAALMGRLQETSVLTVTESSSRPNGTVVNFVESNGQIQFEINLEEAKRKQLAMDARLLRQGTRMQPHSPSQSP
ncbi:YfiR family protein [Aureliella helgolandensis]|uniref:YfiR family protein n=1 Tax=Aureliella helgolandensis TaxID=2527968 RepID=A0A518G099_9BACT|nr:YfiR family protein [Aureliella helgolandensis]QDV22028.1 hypothetical protein Q31a_03070 [Aureliella helgolandensis]